MNGSILFASPEHPGELNPLLSIVLELADRGHADLWVSSHEEARPRVEGKYPVGFLSAGPVHSEIDESVYSAMVRGPMTTAGMAALARRIMREEAAGAVYAATLEHIDQVRPRLMVIDALSPGAFDAAIVRNIPYVVTIPYPASSFYQSRLPWRYPTPGSGLPSQVSGLQAWKNVSYRLRLQAAMLSAVDRRSVRRRKAAGIANVFGQPEKYAATARAVFAFSAFGIEYPFSAPDNLHMLGPMIPPVDPSGPEDELDRWLDAHPSVVYVCLGTMARLTTEQLTTLAQALDRLGPKHHVLWKLPKDQQAQLPAGLGDHIRLEEWVPSQLGVLAHENVRAFVTHGGGNGLHEGIYFGKPLLVMPFWLDCYDFAARAVDAGVGLALDRPPHFTADELVGKANRLLDEEDFAERSRYWGAQLRNAGGVGRAADLILEMAGSEPLVGAVAQAAESGVPA
jgi:polyene glycosyltransferase